MRSSLSLRTRSVERETNIPSRKQIVLLWGAVKSAAVRPTRLLKSVRARPIHFIGTCGVTGVAGETDYRTALFLTVTLGSAARISAGHFVVNTLRIAQGPLRICESATSVP